jgi:hypothetical protein
MSEIFTEYQFEYTAYFYKDLRNTPFHKKEKAVENLYNTSI